MTLAIQACELSQQIAACTQYLETEALVFCSGFFCNDSHTATKIATFAAFAFAMCYLANNLTGPSKKVINAEIMNPKEKESRACDRCCYVTSHVVFVLFCVMGVVASCYNMKYPKWIPYSFSSDMDLCVSNGGNY